jgi:hypothetical protein
VKRLDDVQLVKAHHLKAILGLERDIEPGEQRDKATDKY